MADVMKLGLVLSAVDKMSRIINGATENATKKFHNIEKAMHGINTVSNRMFIAGGIAAAGIYKAVEAAEDDAASQAKLRNVFRQMWGNSGAVDLAAEKQLKYADALSFQIGKENEVINTVQAKLATFRHLSNVTAISEGIYQRATKAAFDMGAVGFGEAAQNAVMLGKALDSPMTMIKALRKQGTIGDQDIVSIQGIFKTKGLLAAQKAILEAVEKQVKGTGIATAKATDIMKVGFSEVVEAIGGAFLPTVDEAKNKMISVFQPTIDWINKNHKLIITISKIAVGLLATAAVLRTFTMLMTIGKGIMIAYNFIMGLTTGAMILFRMQYYGMIAAQKLSLIWTGAVTAATWLFSAALWSTGIPEIVLAVVALGAGLYMLVKHWDVVTASMKKFGAYLLSGVLRPIIWVLEAIGKLTGAKWAINMAANLNAFKSKMDVTASAPIHSRAMSAVTSVSNSRMNATNSNQSNVHYSPTININGNGVTHAGIASILNDDKKSFQDKLKEYNDRYNRLSYAK